MSDQTTDEPDLTVGHEHLDLGAGWLRPAVFGMMDGLVSNFALIAGVAGAAVASRDVALTGLAGLVSGAFSMGAGEYVSVKSQNESTLADIEIERHELAHNAPAELAELTQSFIDRGVDPVTAASVAEQLSRDPEQALIVHAQEELGVDPFGLPSPWTAAFASFVSFSIGALLPLLPYLLGATLLVVSVIVAGVSLFAAGAISARFTSRSWLFAGARQLLLGGVAAAVTYGIGELFHVSVG